MRLFNLSPIVLINGIALVNKTCLSLSVLISSRRVLISASAHAITADVDIAETAKAAQFFLSDGVIVTGSATGQAASTKEMRGIIYECVCVSVCVACFHAAFVSDRGNPRAYLSSFVLKIQYLICYTVTRMSLL